MAVWASHKFCTVRDGYEDDGGGEIEARVAVHSCLVQGSSE